MEQSKQTEKKCLKSSKSSQNYIIESQHWRPTNQHWGPTRKF